LNRPWFKRSRYRAREPEDRPHEDPGLDPVAPVLEKGARERGVRHHDEAVALRKVAHDVDAEEERRDEDALRAKPQRRLDVPLKPADREAGVREVEAVAAGALVRAPDGLRAERDAPFGRLGHCVEEVVVLLHEVAARERELLRDGAKCPSGRAASDGAEERPAVDAQARTPAPKFGP
jgi:hypothetical protein